MRLGLVPPAVAPPLGRPLVETCAKVPLALDPHRQLEGPREDRGDVAGPVLDQVFHERLEARILLPVHSHVSMVVLQLHGTPEWIAPAGAGPGRGAQRHRKTNFQTSGYSTAAPVRERRMTAGRKREAVLRVLRGEPLELVARELAATAADLSGWRDTFLEAGEASLKSRQRDDRDTAIGRLKTKVGELTMDNELLGAKIDRLEAGSGNPFAQRTPARRAPSSRSPRAAPTAQPASAGSGASPAWASTVVGMRRSWRPRRGAGRGRRGRCRTGPWSGRPSGCSSTAPSTARAPARSGRGCATPACAPPRSGCAA